MRKNWLLILVIVVVAPTLYAERTVLIQAMFMQTSRSYEDGASTLTTRFSEVGVNFVHFRGEKLGFYSTGTFLFPFDVKRELNGVAIPASLDAYDGLKLGLDLLVGAGYAIPITPSFVILPAAGLHFGGVVLLSSNVSYDPYLRYNLGPGLAVNAMYYVTEKFNLNIGVLGAWDFFEFLSMPEISEAIQKKGGITWAISAGIGFRF